MEFYTLASGSSGNCSLVCAGDTLLLIDAGISCRRIEQSLRALGRTLGDLTAAMNRTLTRHGLPERTRQQMRTALGNGARRLMELSVPAGTDSALFETLLAEYNADYAAHCRIETAPYPGVAALLRTLHTQGRKLAIEIRGCFWHRCPVCSLSVPKKNLDYWEAKFARNVERDEQNLAALEAAGWKVLVLWEHQLKKKELPATRRLLYEFVRREDDPDYDEAFPVCEGE